MQVRGIRIGIDEKAVFFDFCGYFGIKPLTFVRLYDTIMLMCLMFVIKSNFIYFPKGYCKQ